MKTFCSHDSAFIKRKAIRVPYDAKSAKPLALSLALEIENTAAQLDCSLEQCDEKSFHRNFKLQRKKNNFSSKSSKNPPQIQIFCKNHLIF